jgi:drug/metabolite transporter (DMT)-like permease
MDLPAISLLMLAALTHSAWNLLAKGSRDKQVFLWLALLGSLAIFFPPFLLLYAPVPPAGWVFIALSGALEAAYFLLLGGAYQRGDLSLVYPLARGSAILFVALLAGGALGERVPLLGLAGIGGIVAGVYVLHLRALDRRALLAPLRSVRERPSQLALLTGAIIAGYSVVDKAGVQHVAPGPYLYLTFVVAGLILTPYMLLARRSAAVAEWQANRGRILVVAVLSVVTYGLVLAVLTTSRVSYVAAVREIAVVFAAVLGAVVLREPFGDKKVAGALLIFAGIVCITLAR